MRDLQKKFPKKIVIIGAGPAGLAAGHCLSRQGVETILVEKEAQVGGLSRTICFGGNYFDIGGHRFYTKNNEVMGWWRSLLKEDFLTVPRSSRIYYQGRLFRYPISLKDVLLGLGFFDAIWIFFSYLKSRFFPYRQETNLKEWLTNRFGHRLYKIFFKDYSEKVWGIPCERISADWAAERIKGVSVLTTLRHALLKGRGNSIKTFISEFYFPRLGAGMMYEAAAREITAQGAQIHFSTEVSEICHKDRQVIGLICRNGTAKEPFEIQGTDYCSSMPITSLVQRMNPPANKEVLTACEKLRYRDLVMVYLIIKKESLFKDQWIYVHSPDIHVSRIQNFNNWSRDMVVDPKTTSLGLEYFCQQGDAFWKKTDEELIRLASDELERLKLLLKEEIFQGYVVRVSKAYPVYEKGYREALTTVKQFVTSFSNLQCIGRYGMFHYNCMDHPVQTGFLAAQNVLGSQHDLWALNERDSYDD